MACLPLLAKRGTTPRLVAFDPGVSTFSYAILEAQKGRPVLLEHRLNPSVVRGLTYDLLGKEVQMFKEFLKHLTDLGATHVVAERFQSRGGTAQGVTPEAINWQLCLAHEHFGATKSRFFIPSQWKSAYQRAGVDLKELYKRVKTIGITAHQTDASCIGIWVLSKMLAKPLPSSEEIYDMLDSALRDIPDRVERARAKG